MGGRDSFFNNREKIVEEIDDDFFDYGKPLDFVTRGERRTLLKLAKGDEKKAEALLLQGDGKTGESEGESAVEGKEGESVEEGKEGKSVGESKEGESVVENSSTSEGKVEKKKKKKKKKKKVVDDTIAGDDMDILGMD